MTKSKLTADEARAMVASTAQRLRIKGVMVFFLVFVTGILAVVLGQGWARNADVSWSTFAFALVAVPLFLFWLMFHDFDGLSRKVEKLIVVIPAAAVLALVVAFAVMNVDMIDWEEALWGFAVFAVLVLSAGLAGAITAGFSNIRKQDT